MTGLEAVLLVLAMQAAIWLPQVAVKYLSGGDRDH